jgi:hypothetical protein
MYYSGTTNVPGAPGNLLAGSPGYMMDRDIIDQRLDNYDIDRRGRQNFNSTGSPNRPAPAPMPAPMRGPQLFPLAGTSNLSSAIANLLPGAPGNNAGFYGGPQMGQAPAGFQSKTVY